VTNPVSKTFYNHRIFVIYHPDSYRRYLLDIVDRKEWEKLEQREQFRLTLGLMAWGTILVYQARMVAADFHRRLKALVDANGEFLHQDPSLPLGRPMYRQQIAMQLAIEIVARAPEVRERSEETPIVAQYIYDTLYMPSFYHERGRGEASAEADEPTSFKMTREELVQHLWLRSRGERGTPDKSFISPATVEYLFDDVLDNYFRLLADPAEIQRKTHDYADEQSKEEDRRIWRALADVVNKRPIVDYKFDRKPQHPQPTANGTVPPNG
jgi:hypothetical protein